MLKSGVRILAIDDSSFNKKDKQALAVGVIGRENEIEGILSFKVDVDGDDATEKIIRKVQKSHFSDQIRLIVLHGVTLAGLNMIDMIKVNESLGIPVVSIVRRKPHSKKLEQAIRVLKTDSKRRLALLRNLNTNLEIKKQQGFYVQCAGISNKDFLVLQETAVRLLRIAHLVANGIAKGESKGRI